MLLHPKTCLFATCSSHMAYIMVLRLSSFVFQFFFQKTQGFQFSILLSYWLFSRVFQSNLDSLQRSFLHCYLLLILCNKWSIATNKSAMATSLFSALLVIAAHITAYLWLFAHMFCSDWINAEKFLAPL